MFKLPARKKYPLVILLPTIWFGILIITIVLFIVVFFFNFKTSGGTQKYALYSSKPLVLGEMTAKAVEGDSRAEKIDQVYAKYGCPMEGTGEIFVREADKNNIPYWVVPAISFQESSCGKNVPKVDGSPTYNAWGWAVYGNTVKEFRDWEHGISVVSKYMNERFFSQGITDLCEIMRIYTPPSQGSWCEGVDYFKDIIHDYQSPTSSLIL